MPYLKLILAAIITAFHSFAFADELTTITAAPPTPTLAARGEIAGGPGTPIMSTIAFAYSDLPHEAYPYTAIRGPQTGYNDCKKQGDKPDAQCQTLIVNSLGDFCLWGSPETGANGTISVNEGAVIAYCTQPGYGARVIPQGMITSAQFIKTSAYIQITGRITNAGLNLTPDDFGGELDPHGSDLQGNPIGGLVYSNNTVDSTDGALTQAMNWNMFVGNGVFCVKVCFNKLTSPDYCQNRYDQIGCTYNMPSDAPDNEFTACDGDLQDVVGVYVGADQQTTTWKQPETVIEPPPYTPRIPASRNCKTFASTDLFNAAPTPTGGSSTTTTSGANTTPTNSKTDTTSSGGSQTSSPAGSGSAYIVDIPVIGLFAAMGCVLLSAALL